VPDAVTAALDSSSGAAEHYFHDAKFSSSSASFKVEVEARVGSYMIIWYMKCILGLI